MSELHGMVEQAQEGGYLARTVGVDIFSEADDLEAWSSCAHGFAMRCAVTSNPGNAQA